MGSSNYQNFWLTLKLKISLPAHKKPWVSFGPQNPESRNPKSINYKNLIIVGFVKVGMRWILPMTPQRQKKVIPKILSIFILSMKNIRVCASDQMRMSHIYAKLRECAHLEKPNFSSRAIWCKHIPKTTNLKTFSIPKRRKNVGSNLAQLQINSNKSKMLKFMTPWPSKKHIFNAWIMSKKTWILTW